MEMYIRVGHRLLPVVVAKTSLVHHAVEAVSMVLGLET